MQDKPECGDLSGFPGLCPREVRLRRRVSLIAPYDANADTAGFHVLDDEGGEFSFKLKILSFSISSIISCFPAVPSCC